VGISIHAGHKVSQIVKLDVNGVAKDLTLQPQSHYPGESELLNKEVASGTRFHPYTCSTVCLVLVAVYVHHITKPKDL
jgi:hypothetical protein